jgi:hypothetical protein
MADTWVIPLPYRRPPLSKNVQLHHMTKNRIVQQVKKDGLILAKFRKVPPLRAALVELVWFKGDNRRADPDNISDTLKPLMDGLVLAHVLPDDSGKYVLGTQQRVILRASDPYPAAGARMELRITDASALAPID